MIGTLSEGSRPGTDPWALNVLPMASPLFLEPSRQDHTPMEPNSKIKGKKKHSTQEKKGNKIEPFHAGFIIERPL